MQTEKLPLQYKTFAREECEKPVPLRWAASSVQSPLFSSGPWPCTERDLQLLSKTNKKKVRFIIANYFKKVKGIYIVNNLN